MQLKEQMEAFFSSQAYAVVGASSNRAKFGNKVLRCYMQHNLKVYPVNLSEKEIEGLVTVPRISDLPLDVVSISVVTPYPITEKIVQEASARGVKNIWMQPGAESQKAIDDCVAHGINVIAGGPCILVQLGFEE